MNSTNTIAEPVEKGSKKVHHHRWDRAWKRALDARAEEVLDKILRVDLKGAILERGPDEHDLGPRVRITDRVYLARRESGPTDVIHIEVQVAHDRHFERRLLAYFSHLDWEFRDEEAYNLHQFAILPTGTSKLTGHRRRNNVVLGYEVFNVPQTPVQQLLDGPLPTLAFWSTPKPLELMGHLMQRIAEIPDVEARSAVIDLGMLHSDEVGYRFADELRRNGMHNLLDNTDIGQEILERGLERGLAQGNARFLTALLKQQYGTDSFPDQLVARLSRLDPEQALALVTSSDSLEELADSAQSTITDPTPAD